MIIALGTTDLLFALDSIPAIYGLTKEPYIVLTANLFALMGLRQLYFLIGGLLKSWCTSASGWPCSSPSSASSCCCTPCTRTSCRSSTAARTSRCRRSRSRMSLAAIVLILGTTTVLSLMKTRRDERDALDA